MADEAAVGSAKPVKGASAPMLALTVMGSVLLSTAAAGALGWWLLQKHKVVLPVEAATTAAPAHDADPKPTATHMRVLDPLLVNLADPDGTAYLRLVMVLSLRDDPKAKKEEAKPVPGADAAMRDVVLDVLGREQAATLLTPDGKAALKTKLLTALKSRVPGAGVEDVYFTDFLVQR